MVWSVRINISALEFQVEMMSQLICQFVSIVPGKIKTQISSISTPRYSCDVRGDYGQAMISQS